MVENPLRAGQDPTDSPADGMWSLSLGDAIADTYCVHVFRIAR